MKNRIIAAVKRLTAALLILPVLGAVPAAAQTEEPDSLYALSAVLMDGDSGRVLYEKDGEVPRPNASTTKVLTCIVALENAPGDDYVTVSANAASQPEVRLNIREGEQYYLEDLLYSLMLKSHNDSAVAIAEHIAGSTEQFAVMMNQKAREIGCRDTHFVTPNGLDAEDTGGIHHTTAQDLALIMRYAIRNKTFVHITQTRQYSFSDLAGKRQFTIQNANALLDMMDGVISGKTGFTGDAGYCYVCACTVHEKTFVVALLGCGWPNHKSYKWSDTKKLLAYGDENFEYRSLWQDFSYQAVLVENGIVDGASFDDPIYLKGRVEVSQEEKEEKLLMKKEEAIRMQVDIPQTVQAPVKKNDKIGEVICMMGPEVLRRYPIRAEQNVEKITYQWYARRLFHDYFH